MAQQGEDDLTADETPGYQAPAKKSVDEILKTDADDESLVVYKKALLGSVGAVFPNDPRHVIVEKLALIVEGRPDIELDLKNLSEQKTLVLKEGCTYKVRIYFYVQREIVQGLKYVQQTYRAGIRVDKSTFMVGSYAPKTELQSYTTKEEEAPSGMLSRGIYNMKGLFTDDDKNEHLKWEWKLEIKKTWE